MVLIRAGLSRFNSSDSRRRMGPDVDRSKSRRQVHYCARRIARRLMLGGRAVQDVWRVPLDPADARRMRGSNGTGFYDPKIAARSAIANAHNTLPDSPGLLVLP